MQVKGRRKQKIGTAEQKQAMRLPMFQGES